jgi:hypothetical protein
MSTNLTLDELIGYQVRQTAEWRRAKAEEFPDDGRNLEAAPALDRLAEELEELEGSPLHQRLDELTQLSHPDGGDEFTNSLSSELRSIGFGQTAPSGRAFVEWCCKELEDIIRRHRDAAIEDDPAVVAARQALDEARTYARAKLRQDVVCFTFEI